MALFQTSVLKSYLAQLDTATLDKAYKKYQAYFWNTTIQENIKTAKEEQYQATFLHELFVNILGYTLFPNPHSNLTTEFKNEKNARKTDAAILKDGSAIGVIELKGTNTKDLESIRRQAFDYKANQKGCVYVITSNFEKLRFYINDATEFEEFDLFTLSRKRFELLYLCLHLDKVLNNVPLKIKEASIAEEEQITKSFYKDYSLFKRELYRDLIKNNAKTVKAKLADVSSSLPENDTDQEDRNRLEKNVRLTLFKKSQKLIDRFLFIFFAEDRMLLPSNSTLQILNKWRDDWDFGDERSLYQLFKQYFSFLDQGRKGTEKRAEIYAYNGGLFKPDAILDALEIDNDLLYKHTLKLSNYDFESQVDVNILGHIFENSLNEIESVNAEIEGGEFDKQTSKRKKDGVFYTPKYITKYIVENTVGKLCEEKKAELGFDEEQYFKGRKNRNKDTILNLVAILDEYREWLLQITICDPACGSGAFLNQALDFLIKEHSYIDELKTKILGGGLQFPDIENTILENNIYGVDLNEESVEIAKLSLWLRTAQPRRKLNDLSSNIKCGNSLIDDKKVAGDKAFKWETAFAKVFSQGGFDVVIGNPPYVRNEFISKKDKKFFDETFEVSTGKSDLYVYFFEKACSILSSKGKCGLIVSSKYTKTKYGKVLIEFLQEKTSINNFIDFKDLDVFKGIIAYPSIILFKNEAKPLNHTSKLLIVSNENYQEIENQFTGAETVNQNELFRRLGSWNSNGNDGMFEILKKLENENPKLIDIIGKPEVGVKTGFNAAYIYDSDEVSMTLNKSKSLKKYAVGREVKKYSPQNFTKRILVPYEKDGDKYHLVENINDYPQLVEELMKHRQKLEKRAIIDKGVLNGTKEWYEYQQIKLDFPFHKDYIIYPDISADVNFTLVNDVLYDMTCFGLPTSSKNVLAILNSKLISAYLNVICVKARGGYLRLKNQYISKIPIPVSYENLNAEMKVDSILESNISHDQCVFSFQVFISSQFSIDKLSRKLESWHELTFADFIKELNKAVKATNKFRIKEGLEPIAALTKKDEFEWMELFEPKKKEAQELQAQIQQTEKEIDQMVYELYGLTEEEILIVEGS